MTWSNLLRHVERLFRLIPLSVWAPLPFAVLSFFAMLPMHYAGIDDPLSFVPVPHIVLAYAIPFGFGWLLFWNADLLDVHSKRAWLHSSIGLVAAVLNIVLVSSIDDRGANFYVARAALALASWALIFGITGLFLRYFSAPSALRRYVCDSSDFLYIAHLPMIGVFQLMLKDVPLPPVMKVPIVLAGTIAVLFPIYHYAVRPTIVGELLNGRRSQAPLIVHAAA